MKSLWKITLTALGMEIIAVGVVLWQYQVRKTTRPNLDNTFVEEAREFFKDEEPPSFPPLTLDSIFGPKDFLEGCPKEKSRTLLFAGDVLLARSVNFQIQQRNNPNYPFEKVAEVLRAADLTFVDLENPLVEGCLLTNEGMVFCGDPKNVGGLVYAGVGVAALSNNHAGDYGEEGLENTAKILEESGILPTGLGKPSFKDIRGLKVVFLGYNTIGANVDTAKIAKQITEAETVADVVVVYFHWGVEYTHQPTTNQIDLAHLAIDNGASLVVGSHPHWIQGVEIYKETPIIYSLGNFVFDQGWSEKTMEGMVAKTSFCEEKLIDIDFLPVKMGNWTQPYFLKGEEEEKLLDLLEEISF